MDFIEELTWRGMIHQMMPGTDEQLKKGMTAAYLGIDPAAKPDIMASVTNTTLIKIRLLYIRFIVMSF